RATHPVRPRLRTAPRDPAAGPQGDRPGAPGRPRTRTRTCTERQTPMRQQRTQWFPRALGWLTLGYGAYTLARPQSLVHAAGPGPGPGPVSRRGRLLGMAVGARDLLSGLAMVTAVPGTPLRIAVAARVACDAGDVIGFAGAVPPRYRPRVLAAAG